MPAYQKIESIIYSMMDDINQQLVASDRLEKKPDEKIFGTDGKLDSLGLVSFIVGLEEKLREEFQVDLTLVDEQALSLKESPFQAVRPLVEHISKLLPNADLSN